MPAPARSRSTESQFRFLYFGGDLEFMAVLRKALTKAGCRLVTCSDRGSAILFLKSDIRYDLMLIDFEWQKEEGLKLARLAHSRRHRKRMPIILLVATRSDEKTGAFARKVGAGECVMKTPDMVGVVEAINRLLVVEKGMLKADKAHKTRSV
jgi:DNA-binding response OmpR family regulator